MDPVILFHQLRQVLEDTSMFNLIVFALLFLLSILCLLKFTRTSKLNFPPSPLKLPLIGNLHQVGALPHQSFRTLSEKYGPLMLLHFGSSPTLIVSSAAIAKEILRSNDNVFMNRPQTRVTNVLFYGCTDVAFAQFGEYWRRARKLCVHEILSERRVRALSFVREEEVANMIERIRLSIFDGATIDLSEMFATISNNIISRSTLGRIYEKEGDESFGELTKKTMTLIGALCFKDLIPSLGWMDILTGLVASLKRNFKALHDFLDQVIEEHQAKKDDGDSDKEDFVDILLHLQRDGMVDFNFTRDNLKAILMDMFVGGTDTTATAMEWAMAELAKNPSVMKKAQEEVRRIVGDKSEVNQSDIQHMHYLKCIVKETLRLHAPLMITRQSSASTKLEGYDIPPKTTILINAWAIQRDPKLWDRPEEFDPERFIDISVDYQGQQNQFLPFGAGRRICPGSSLAIAEAECVLANLLYWFDWKLPDGATEEDLDMSDVFQLVICKKVPLLLVPVVHYP